MPRTLPPNAARPWWRARTLLPVLFALLLTSGTALAQQLCESELRAAVPAAGTDTEIATALARAVVEAIEPALPRGREASNGLVEPNARWLSERHFLPGNWKDSEPLTPQAWASLLAGLQAPYKVKPLELSGNLDTETLIQEAGLTLESIADSLRPLAMIATSKHDRSRVELAGVAWNWTPWPRLLLFDPENLPASQGDFEGVLASIGTCAWQPTAYVSTNSAAAADYYLGSADASATILATDRSPTGAVVPKELEEAVLTFKADLLGGASVAAIGFEGSGPSVGQLTGLLFRARTNVGMFDLLYYLALP